MVADSGEQAVITLKCTSTPELGVEWEVEWGVVSVEALVTPILTCQTISPIARESKAASDQVEAGIMKKIRNIKVAQNFSCPHFQINKLTEP